MRICVRCTRRGLRLCRKIFSLLGGSGGLGEGLDEIGLRSLRGVDIPGIYWESAFEDMDRRV